MTTTLGELAELVDGEVLGNAATPIAAVGSTASGGPETIAFAESRIAVEVAVASNVGAVIVKRSTPAGAKPLLAVDAPRLAFIAIANHLHPEVRPAPGVHATAVVAESARLGTDVHVGPHAVVEEGVEIGDRSVVGPGCVLGRGAGVGEDSRLHPRVVLYPGVTVGARVVLHAGVVLGCDGFGYADGPKGKVKFPQLGTLVIEDDVEVGANTTIDRAALDETVIRRGGKIDNQVMVAHNVTIGEHTVIAAQAGIAGSATIGDRVIIAGQAGIGDGAVVGDHAVIGGGAAVPTRKKLPGAKIYWGSPARPLEVERRRIFAIGRIEKLIGTVKELKARVEALEGGAS